MFFYSEMQLEVRVSVSQFYFPLRTSIDNDDPLPSSILTQLESLSPRFGDFTDICVMRPARSSAGCDRWRGHFRLFFFSTQLCLNLLISHHSSVITFSSKFPVCQLARARALAGVLSQSSQPRSRIRASEVPSHLVREREGGREADGRPTDRRPTPFIFFRRRRRDCPIRHIGSLSAAREGSSGPIFCKPRSRSFVC